MSNSVVCSICNGETYPNIGYHVITGQVFCVPCWCKDGPPLKDGDVSCIGGQTGTWTSEVPVWGDGEYE